MKPHPALKRSVIGAIADDYESFGHVVQLAAYHLAEFGIRPSPTEVLETLTAMIEDGEAQAYFLSPQPPHATPVPFDPGRINEFWFYITPKGLRVMEAGE